MRGPVLTAVIFTALYIAARWALRYGQALERRTPGLPADGKGCMSPREQAAMDGIEARYHGSPAREERP